MHRALMVDHCARTNAWAGRHPGEKALGACAGLGLAVAHPSVMAPLVTATAALCALRCAQVPIRTAVATMAGPILLLALFALPTALSLSLDEAPQVAWSGHTADRAVMAFARGCAGVMTTVALALTTPVTHLAWLLARLGVPRSFVETLLVTHRFLFSLSRTLDDLCAAQRARLGFIGWVGTARSAGRVAGALFGRAMDHALAQERGLTARGGMPQTMLTCRPLSLRLCAGVLAGAALLASLLEASR